MSTSMLDLSGSAMKKNEGNTPSSHAGLFKPGVNWIKFHEPRTGEPPMVIRILPGLDYSLLSNEEQFKLSTVPFIDSDGESTSWAQIFRGYMYFGKLKTHIISPDTFNTYKHDFPKPNVDAFVDLARFIRFNTGKYVNANSPEFTEEEQRLIAKPEDKNDFYKLPSKPRLLVASNALWRDGKSTELKQGVGVFSYQMLQVLMTTTKTTVPMGSTSIKLSEKFPNLLFGDITDKDEGCLLECRYWRNPYTNNDMLILAPSRDKDNKTQEGYSRYPVSDEILAKRYALCDVDDVLDIWSYQRQVDLLCKDPMIPIDLLKKAEDYSVFSKAGAVLNYSLREEGEAMLKMRESYSGGANTTKTYYTSRTPVKAAQAPVSTGTKFTQVEHTNALSSLPPIQKPVVDTPKPEVSPVETPSDLITEDYKEVSDQPEVSTQAINDESQVDSIIVRATKKLTDTSEFNRFVYLHNLMMNDVTKLTTDDMKEYFKLNEKVMR